MSWLLILAGVFLCGALASLAFTLWLLAGVIF